MVLELTAGQLSASTCLLTSKTGDRSSKIIVQYLMGHGRCRENEIVHRRDPTSRGASTTSVGLGKTGPISSLITMFLGHCKAKIRAIIGLGLTAPVARVGPGIVV